MRMLTRITTKELDEWACMGGKAFNNEKMATVIKEGSYPHLGD